MQQALKLDEFKQFLMRGNVIDLAIAVIIGLALVALVDSIVTDMITPLIAMIMGEHSLASLMVNVNDAEFRYGVVLDNAIAFIVIAAIVFYVIVLPMNRIMARFVTEEPPAPLRQCPECLSDVPELARRCAYCTSVLEPVVPEESA